MPKRIPIGLLAAQLFGLSGCYRAYRPGVELPVPRSAADTSAISALQSARFVYMFPRPGWVVVEVLRVEYSTSVVHRANKDSRDPTIAVRVDSTQTINASRLNMLPAVAVNAVIAVAAIGVVGGIVAGGYITCECHDETLIC